MVQLSHLSMTTGKTIALTIWTFVGKVISLLFNMLSRFVLTFLPRSCLVGYYKAILHVCNWNSRRRREMFEEMMLKHFQIWLKKIMPQIQAAQKTTSRKKIWSKHMTVKLLKTQERGNIKSSWDRERESTAIKLIYWTFCEFESLCVLGYSDRMVKSQNISMFSWILLLRGNRQASKWRQSC